MNVKKRVIAFILLLALIVTMLFVAFLMSKKPEVEDLFVWMSETYDIECLDNGCQTFRVFDENKQSILMETTKENVSSSVFKIKVERQYRNQETPTYYLDLRVEGFFDDFNILEEKSGKINKK